MNNKSGHVEFALMLLIVGILITVLAVIQKTTFMTALCILFWLGALGHPYTWCIILMFVLMVIEGTKSLAKKVSKIF